MKMQITNNMTVLSKQAFSEATIKLNSAEEAISFLKNDLTTRTVRSNLEKLAGGQDMKVVQKTLVDGLMANHPDMKRDSVERRVRGWLNPKSLHSLKKEDAIEITFLLHAGIDKADEFIALVSEEKLHWRSPEEIVYIFGLMHGMTYTECNDLLDLPVLREIREKVSDCASVDEIEADGYTEFVRMEVEKIKTKEELISYLQNNYGKLGHLHNTAYQMFTEMLGKLETPSSMEDELGLFQEEEYSEKYTVKDILTDFFYQDLVLTAKQRAVKAKKNAKKQHLSQEQQYTLDLVQKTIADSWPDEVTISKMKNRKMDVTRKILILLFLATDGDYDEEYGWDYDLEEEDVFEDILERLNDMLFFCGFSLLDPRNPFDWLIIYCIYVPDLFDVDPRLQSLLEELFRE